MSDVPPPLHLFEGFGVELESMIVSAEMLDVRPVADELLQAAAAADPEGTGAPAPADQAVSDDPGYLSHFGVGDSPCDVGEIWQTLLETEAARDPGFAAEWMTDLRPILDQGPLARRILLRIGAASGHPRLHATWQELAECLNSNRPFVV